MKVDFVLGCMWFSWSRFIVDVKKVDLIRVGYF